MRETPVLRCTCPPLLQVLRYRWHESPSTVPKLDVSGPCKHQQPPHTDHFFFRVTFHYSSESCPQFSRVSHSFISIFIFYSFGFHTGSVPLSPFYVIIFFSTGSLLPRYKHALRPPINHQTKQKTPLNPISTLAFPPFSVCSHSQT